MTTHHVLTEEERKELVKKVEKSCELCSEIQQKILDYRIGNGIQTNIKRRGEEDIYLSKLQAMAMEIKDLQGSLLARLEIQQ